MQSSKGGYSQHGNGRKKTENHRGCNKLLSSNNKSQTSIARIHHRRVLRGNYKLTSKKTTKAKSPKMPFLNTTHKLHNEWRRNREKVSRHIP
mmetsp:Transcript_8341/g.15940  ORF Transcript_8341/g.15940 Transcript_8341/m.15940 type:complete len:92 (+) Transcript_8341:106-381(+)